MPSQVAVLLAASAIVLSGCGTSHGTIGAILGQSPDGKLFVRDTPEGLSASEAGLQPGDEVLLIDGRDVRPLSPQKVHELLSGEPGTRVKLTVVRGDEVIRTTLVRRPPPRSPVPRPAGTSNADP